MSLPFFTRINLWIAVSWWNSAPCLHPVGFS